MIIDSSVACGLELSIETCARCTSHVRYGCLSSVDRIDVTMFETRRWQYGNGSRFQPGSSRMAFAERIARTYSITHVMNRWLDTAEETVGIVESKSSYQVEAQSLARSFASGVKSIDGGDVYETQTASRTFACAGVSFTFSLSHAPVFESSDKFFLPRHLSPRPAPPARLL